MRGREAGRGEGGDALLTRPVASAGINAVVLCLQMESETSLGQVAGRAARVDEDEPRKKHGYVVMLKVLSEAAQEERQLEELHGDAYREWAAAVPRFWPAWAALESYIDAKVGLVKPGGENES